ncbi:MAG: hypothetical protein V3U98_02425 [Acidobacteriota bacterium]
MPTSNDHKRKAGRRGSRQRRDRQSIEERELHQLLQEAEEILRQAEVPSGGWDSGPPAEASPAVAAASWSEHIAAAPTVRDLEGIDPETAFWLLFPPRGTA